MRPCIQLYEGSLLYVYACVFILGSEVDTRLFQVLEVCDTNQIEKDKQVALNVCVFVYVHVYT